MAISTVRTRRRKILVKPEIQLKYVGIILLAIISTAALSSYVVYYTSAMLYGEKLAQVYPQGRLVSAYEIINFRIFLSVLLMTPIVVLIGLFLSHRIAGPLVRMERFLSDISSGDLSSHITLREHDDLIPVADGMNSVVNSFKASIFAQKAKAEKIKKGISLLKASLGDPGRKAESENCINDIGKEAEALSFDLGRFKLD